MMVNRILLNTPKTLNIQNVHLCKGKKVNRIISLKGNQRCHFDF